MNKKYFLAIAAVAVSAALYSCGSGDVVDFYNDEIDGVPGQAMLDEMNFTNSLIDESVVNGYKDKYGNGSAPPPTSSSSVEPEPTDSTLTGGGEIPLSSSSQGPILPPVFSSEKSSSSSSSAPEKIPTLSSSSSSLAESSSSSIGVTPQSSSANTPTPVSSSSVGGDVVVISETGGKMYDFPVGEYEIKIEIDWGYNKSPDVATFQCQNTGTEMDVTLQVGSVDGTIKGWSGDVTNVPNNTNGILSVKNTAVKCTVY